MTYREVELNDETMQRLIALSADWEAEQSCYGYRENTAEDIVGNRVFLAEEGGGIIGYLFGHIETAKNIRSILPDGTSFFEIEELYVRPEYRSRGVGKALFGCAEAVLKRETTFLLLSTATKNWRAVLHFYIDEVGMDFWSARLFKKI